MEERGTRKKRTRGTSEKESSVVLFQSFCITVFAFLAVVLTHQLIVGVLSYVFDYDTQVTFGKVVSKPYDTRNWSSNRVLAMYVAPSVFFIVAAISIATAKGARVNCAVTNSTLNTIIQKKNRYKPSTTFTV